MLVIAGPGHPVGGVAPDLTTPGAPSLDPAGLGSAFAAAGLGGGTKLDLLFYQAPLMGSIEVEAASAPYARYMVASPDEYWSLPLYSGLLPLLAGPKQDQPAEVARGVLEVYATVLGGYSSGLARSLAAYDLGQAPAARAALDSLGSAMQTALVGDSATVRAAIGKVLRTIQSYDSSGNGLIGGLASGKATFLTAREDALVDLARLASAISAEPTMPPAVQSAASSLQTASASLTLAYDTASGTGIAGLPVAFSNSLGTSVFFPDGARLGGQPAMVQRYLYGAAGAPRDGAWAEFLRAYLATVVGDGPGGVTAGPQGGARVSIPAGGTLNLDRWLPFVAR
jgi:hypothetical protein